MTLQEAKDAVAINDGLAGWHQVEDDHMENEYWPKVAEFYANAIKVECEKNRTKLTRQLKTLYEENKSLNAKLGYALGIFEGIDAQKGVKEEFIQTVDNAIIMLGGPLLPKESKNHNPWPSAGSGETT